MGNRYTGPAKGETVMDKFFTISLGDVVVTVSLVTFLWRLEKWATTLIIEHEMLIQDYMERKGIRHLHTRPRSK